MPPLSLDCLTLTDANPAELILSAAAADFDLVSLWLNPLAAFPNQVLQAHDADRCAAIMADFGVGIHHVEVFDLASDEALEAARPALEIGARLGAKAVLVYNGSNRDRDAVIGLLRRFVAIAAEYGLGVNLEPVSMGATRTPHEAQALIRDADVDAGIVLDTLHFFRMGGRPADIAAIHPGLIRYVQINDGPLDLPSGEWLSEAMGERLYPGEGNFPLVELLSQLPHDIPWAIETPSLRRVAQGVSPAEQAHEAAASLRTLIARLPQA